jgi:arsenical pump membrane protein
VAVLGWAVARPRGLGEVWVAAPAALILVALGALPLGDALDRARELGPTLAFLAGVLALADGCARVGLFDWAGKAIAGAGGGRPVRLLGLTFIAASLTTAALSLDATVVLLTPSVVAAAAAARVRPVPHAYACGHLANAASLLLPVSNLTNLLAFSAAGVGFARFASLMVGPWVAAIAVEWLVLRRVFAADLRGRGVAPAPPSPPPLGPTLVVITTLAGFAASSPLGLDPAWVAVTGALVLALGWSRPRPAELASAVSPGFLVFVLALVIVVGAAQRNGLEAQVAALVPGGAGLLALLAVAALAAVLANALNNLPAILILLPALGGTGPVLAALVGVGVGPNLTYTGSLATLLWRRVLRGGEAEPQAREFLRIGALTVPAALVASVVALWLSLEAIG